MDGPGESYTCTARLKRPVWYSAAWLLVVAINTIGGPLLRAAFGRVGPLVASLGFVVCFIVLWRQTKKQREVIAAAQGLRIEGLRPIARDTIRHARVLHGGGRGSTVLEVTRHAHGTCRLLFERADDALKLLDALRLTEAQRLRRTFLFGVTQGVSSALVIAGVLTASWVSLALVPLIPHLSPFWSSYVHPLLQVGLMSLTGGLATLWLKRAELAGDGLRIVSKRPGAGTRYIAYADIRAVTLDRARVTLDLTNGGTYVLRFFDVTSASNAASALREASANASVSQDATAMVDELARGSRSLDDWLASLRALGRGATDHYRRAAASRSALQAIVASGAMTPSIRVAAAVVLSEAEGTSVNADLRRVAAQTGDPRVERALLRVVAGGSDDDLAIELAQADDEARTAPRRLVG